MRTRSIDLGRQRLIEIDLDACDKRSEAAYKFGNDGSQDFGALIDILRERIERHLLRHGRISCRHPRPLMLTSVFKAALKQNAAHP